jgi:DNA-binding transcriptional ArsR family regulator
LVREKRILRKPEGETKDDIIELLSKAPSRQRFTELKNKLGISKPTLAEHLNTLKKEGKITRRRYGKAVYYSLTNKAWESPETRRVVYSSNIMSYVNEAIAGSEDANLQKLSEKELLKELARKISALILFAQIKGAESGEEWYKTAERVAREIESLIKRRIIYPEIISSELKKDYNPNTIWNKPLGNFGKLRPKIERLYEALRALYPNEMQVLESVYENPKNQGI